VLILNVLDRCKDPFRMLEQAGTQGIEFDNSANARAWPTREAE